MVQTQVTLALSDEDIKFEEQVIQDAYRLKNWLRYLDYKAGAPERERYILYERALKHLPGSYKLWFSYLRERRTAVSNKSPLEPAYENLNNTFERALVFMHKMPRIWIEYLQHLTAQRYVTKCRKAFDRALQSLPVTQHSLLWPLYIGFIQQEFIPVETALRVYRRYVKLEPTQVEKYIEFLIKHERIDEASQQLANVVNDDNFKSAYGKSQHQLWLELCDLICKYPEKVEALNVEDVLRSGIEKFEEETGRLWCALADFFIRLAQFEKARDVYEEGIAAVSTVRDFSLIFDAYSAFEENLITARMEADPNDDDDDDALWSEDYNDVDLRLARLEHLMERRPLLLNSVVLRQNPHNVHEWHKRARILESPEKQILTYTEAVKCVDPVKAVGKPHTLWIAFAKVYETHDDLDNARVIFEKAAESPMKNVDGLASIWCEYAEMEVRHKNYSLALDVMRKATKVPVKRRVTDEDPVQLRVHKSIKLWSLYADLEESLGTLESTRAVYDKILDLRVATPQVILNYAAMLEEKKYFEDAFKVYEKGVNLFNFPHAMDLWVQYIRKFIDRYGGKKVERAREMFEQVLEKVPAKESKVFFLMYAEYEEKHGLARHAMQIYDRATRQVEATEKLQIFKIYVLRASELFGVTKTREIYEKAIENLDDAGAKLMCLKYAELERKLGEVDRARAIYGHGSQVCDPKRDADFWQIWHDFEVAHGNEDTFREMFRVKRSIQAQFGQTNYNSIDNSAKLNQAATTLDGTAGATLKRKREDTMAALEAELPDEEMEKAGGSAANGGEDVQVEEKSVPMAVFGSAAEKGAYEKLKSAGKL